MQNGSFCEQANQILWRQIINWFECYGHEFLFDQIVSGFPTQALNYLPGAS